MNRTKLIFSKTTKLIAILFIIFTTIAFSSCSNHLLDISEVSPQNTTVTGKTPAGQGQNPQNAGNDYCIIEPDSRGIKLTLKDGVSLKPNDGAYTIFDGVPIIMANMDWTETEFIFPFTTQGQNYSVNFNARVSTDNGATYQAIDIYQDCVAGGGIDYTQIINIAPIQNSSVDVDFISSQGYFLVHYTVPSGTIILDESVISVSRFVVRLLLGEPDWSNTLWGGQTQTQMISGDYNLPMVTDISNWANYDYKYSVHVAPEILLYGYGTTIFEVKPSPESALKIYTP